MSEPEAADVGGELAARFRAGDERAFDAILAHYQQRIFNLAYRMLNHREEAADLTQEIFIKVYRSLGQFRGAAGFTTWVYAIALNLARNRIRAFRRTPTRNALSTDAPLASGGDRPALDLPAPGPGPAEEAGRAEGQRMLRQCLAQLPIEFAAAVVMRDLQQMSYQEIGQALRCSLGTVKSRIARGRMLVTAKLKTVNHEP